MKRFIATLVVVVFCLAAAELAQAQGNPFVGTWKMPMVCNGGIL
jgi:hypothetical protein